MARDASDDTRGFAPCQSTTTDFLHALRREGLICCEGSSQGNSSWDQALRLRANLIMLPSSGMRPAAKCERTHSQGGPCGVSETMGPLFALCHSGSEVAR